MSTAGQFADLRWRIVLRVAGLILFVVLANLASASLADALRLELTPRTEETIHRLIMATVAVYGVLIAVPFVPGVEIGLALMVMVGPGIALLVYLATVLGLFASFLIGQFVPQRWLQAILQYFGLVRASRLVGEMEALDTEARLGLLIARAPSKLVPLLLRHRYLALALALNVPGNAVIGGGGGIAMAAGLSKLYSTPALLATLALAVAPVPLAILIFGPAILS